MASFHQRYYNPTESSIVIDTATSNFEDNEFVNWVALQRCLIIADENSIERNRV